MGQAWGNMLRVDQGQEAELGSCVWENTGERSGTHAERSAQHRRPLDRQAEEEHVALGNSSSE